MAGDQASSNEYQVQFYEMKSMCFLLSARQKRYRFLFKQMRDGGNVNMDDYPAMTTSVLETLIRTEGIILGNCKSSTYKNLRGRGGHQKKERMGHTFTQQKGET